MQRRIFMGHVAMGLVAGAVPTLPKERNVEEVFGIIGQIMAVPGRRAELVSILLVGTRDMPGNIAYLIAEDLADDNAIWITEVWNTRTDHENSLKLPAVQAAIARGRPLIAGFGTRAETRPIAYAN